MALRKIDWEGRQRRSWGDWDGAGDLRVRDFDSCKVSLIGTETRLVFFLTRERRIWPKDDPAV